jgi:hypothetical protein
LHDLDHGIEFLTELGKIDVTAPRRGEAIDFTINAVEITNFIGIEVNADGNASGAARDDGIDVVKIFPLSPMITMCGEERLHGLS